MATVQPGLHRSADRRATVASPLCRNLVNGEPTGKRPLGNFSLSDVSQGSIRQPRTAA